LPGGFFIFFLPCPSDKEDLCRIKKEIPYEAGELCAIIGGQGSNGGEAHAVVGRRKNATFSSVQ
jgi:hypothetical protein